MSKWSLAAVAVLHGHAALAELLAGHVPMALMLAGFFIADLGMIWLLVSQQ